MMLVSATHMYVHDGKVRRLANRTWMTWISSPEEHGLVRLTDWFGMPHVNVDSCSVPRSGTCLVMARLVPLVRWIMHLQSIDMPRNSPCRTGPIVSHQVRSSLSVPISPRCPRPSSLGLPRPLAQTSDSSRRCSPIC